MEKLYSKNKEMDEEDLIYMEMNNIQGMISTREEGQVGIQKYPPGEQTN